jgi:peptidyl-prolyl cis-trans isomerase SurA
MKFSVRFLVCAFALGQLASLAADIPPSIIEEIVAKVNGEIVTRGDLLHARQDMEELLKGQGLPAIAIENTVKEREKDILRDRIDRFLLIAKAKDLNITVDNEMTKYMADLQRESKIADPDKFHDYIKEQTGVPFEDFKSETKNTMLTQHVIRQEVSSKMKIDKSEFQKYYDEHKAEFMRDEKVYLREILISTAGKEPAGIAASEKKAKDLASRARKGEKFPEMARDNSDAITAKQYGELGGFKKGELSPTIEGAIWDKPRGFVTEPMKVDAGFLIIKVDEHQKAGQAELADVEPEIMDKLYAPRLTPEVRQFLTKLRAEAFLQIKAGYVDTGAAPGKDTTWSDPATLKPETTTKAEVVTKPHHKKVLWIIPVPGTKVKDSSSSK